MSREKVATTRIYVDFNGLVNSPTRPGGLAVVLDTMGSLRDLSNAGIRLEEGMPLIGVDASDDDEDLEGHGTARYDGVNNWWLIDLDERGVRYVPAGDRTPVAAFNCMSCGESLREQIRDGGLNFGDRCHRCGHAVHSPILPP